MKIASYNSHRSAPFPRALVVKNNQVYSLEGSRRRYPITVPAGILRPRVPRKLAILAGPTSPDQPEMCGPRMSDALGEILLVRCRRGRQRYFTASFFRVACHSSRE